LIYWPGLYEAASLPRYFIIGLISSSILVLWVFTEQGYQFDWHPGFSLILGFFVWAAISTNWSPDPGTSLIDITQLFSMIMLAFLAMQMTRLPAFLSYLIPAILMGATVTAIIGIGQYFGFNPLELRINKTTIPATFLNPNHAAAYFDYIPWLAFTAMFFYQRAWLRWLAAGSLGLCVTYLSINTSRGSLLALGLSGMVFIIVLFVNTEIRAWLKSNVFQRYKELALAIIIPVAFFLHPIYFTPTNEKLDQWDETLLEGKLDKSTNARIDMYLNSLPAILDHPLTGLGYGGMRVGFLPYASLRPIIFRTEDTVVRELHSDPLQYFVELGVPGGLLFIAIFIIIARTGWKTISSSGTSRKAQLALGFWLALIAGATHAMVDFPLRLPTSAAMFWLYTGVLLGLGSTQQLRMSGNSFRIVRPLLSTLGIIGLGFSLIFYKDYLTSNHDLHDAIVNLKKGECVAAAQAAEHGLEAFASDFMLLTAYAQIYSACSFHPSQQLAAMNRVLTLDPTNMRALLTRGDLYNRANKPNLAMADFEKIAIALPNRPYAYAGLGDSARLQSDILRARHYYRAALKRKPNYEYAKRQLETLDTPPTQ